MDQVMPPQEGEQEVSFEVLPEQGQPPEYPPEPQLVRIRLNGKTIEVPPDVADAIQAREENFQRRLSEQGAELGQLRQQVRQEQPQSQPQTPTQDEDLEFFQSPTAAFQRRVDLVREQIMQQIRHEQQLEEARRQFWQNFYQKHSDLAGRERFVNAVFQQELPNLQSLSPAEAQERLAEAIHDLLGEGGSAGTPLKNGPVTTERGSNPPQTRRQPPSPPQQGGTLSDGIRARAEARRRAAFNVQKDNT